MADDKIYEAEEISLGDLGKGNYIIFKTVEDMNNARQEVDDGKGILVTTPDGLTTSFPHRLIYQKIYDGTIRLSARAKTITHEARRK